MNEETEGRGPELDPTRTTPTPEDEASRTIGPYRLLEKIGQGGMGEVWVAEQTEPVRRRVALKVIRAGMDTRQVIARFEAERQALALMDHPAIAKVFDAGETPHGRPFFVMELIRGRKITEHCDRHELSTRERLELFLQVCEGVQHAHQKAIIHRDLKPSNVLVTVVDDRALPKIIDFGVAKATAQRLTDQTVYTEIGTPVGTVEYMSPEQAAMTGEHVDTRSDVYSLGVILYELLVGALPFSARELRKAGWDEIRRKIREDDPLRPSVRVRSMGRSSDAAAHARQSEPVRLASRLKGDLDWITMRALEKDRARRYGSPSDLAADIERHLADRPVMAGPPSVWYRARKFIRRHRVAVGVAATLVSLLVVFAVVTAVQARRIAREAATANQVSVFLQDLFEVSDPGKARGETITARELLERGAERVGRELNDQPEVQARLMATIGDVYRKLGLYEEAEPLLTHSLERRRVLLGTSHPETLRSAHGLGRLLQEDGRYAEAEQRHRETLATRRRVLGRDHPETLESMSSLGTVFQGLGRYAEAEEQHRTTLEARRRVLGEDHPDTLRSAGNLAVAVKSQSRYGEAETLYRETLDGCRRVLGEDHPDTLIAMNNLANLYRRQGLLDDAEALHLESIAIHRRVLGDEHPSTLTALNNLANLYRSQGRYDEAAELHRESLAACLRVLGEDHPRTLQARGNLAVVYMNQGRLARAEELQRESLEAHLRVFGEDHPATIRCMGNLAILHENQGDHDQAETFYLRSLAAIERTVGEDHRSWIWIATDLAELYKTTGRSERARPYVTRLLAGYRKAADRPEAEAVVKNEYAWQLLICEPADLRDPSVALRYALEANAMTDHRNPGFLDTLALAYHRAGRPAAAVETQAKALAALPADHRKRSAYRARLAGYEASRHAAD